MTFEIPSIVFFFHIHDITIKLNPEYKNIIANTNLKKIKMKEVERAIYSLVVIVPNGYSKDEMEDDLNKNIETDADLDKNVVDIEADQDKKLNV